MNVMRENQKNMRAWFYARHPRRAHAQHAPGSLCRIRKETLFPDIFESGKLRIPTCQIYRPFVRPGLFDERFSLYNYILYNFFIACPMNTFYDFMNTFYDLTS